jgi:hypothetical protein
LSDGTALICGDAYGNIKVFDLTKVRGIEPSFPVQACRARFRILGRTLAPKAVTSVFLYRSLSHVSLTVWSGLVWSGLVWSGSPIVIACVTYAGFLRHNVLPIAIACGTADVEQRPQRMRDGHPQRQHESRFALRGGCQPVKSRSSLLHWLTRSAI